jgi:hypothetical protein
MLGLAGNGNIVRNDVDIYPGIALNIHVVVYVGIRVSIHRRFFGLDRKGQHWRGRRGRLGACFDHLRRRFRKGRTRRLGTLLLERTGTPGRALEHTRRGSTFLDHGNARNSGGVSNLVGHQNYALHLFNVMYPDNVRAVQRRRGNGGSGGKRRIGLGRLSEKGFPRRPHQNRVIEHGQLLQMRQKFGVLFLALAESEPRVDHDAGLIHTGVAGAAHGSVEFLRHGANRILHGRQFGPGFGLPAHVVENQTGVSVGGNFGQPGVEGQSAGVVEDFDAVFESPFGYLSLIGIERKGRAQIAAQAFQDRDQTPPFFIGGNTFRTGPGGLGPDIDDVGARFFQFEGAGVGAVGFVIASAVGERVGRQVDDTHDQGAFAQLHF